MSTGADFLGIKAYSWPASGAAVKNACSCTPIPPYSFITRLFIKYMDKENIIFLLHTINKTENLRDYCIILCAFYRQDQTVIQPWSCSLRHASRNCSSRFRTLLTVLSQHFLRLLLHIFSVSSLMKFTSFLRENTFK